eukprot:112449-Amphidinium_carterae.1
MKQRTAVIIIIIIIIIIISCSVKYDDAGDETYIKAVADIKEAEAAAIKEAWASSLQKQKFNAERAALSAKKDDKKGKANSKRHILLPEFCCPS